MKDNDNIDEIIEIDDLNELFLNDENLMETIAAIYPGDSSGSGKKWNYNCKY